MPGVYAALWNLEQAINKQCFVFTLVALVIWRWPLISSSCVHWYMYIIVSHGPWHHTVNVEDYDKINSYTDPNVQTENLYYYTIFVGIPIQTCVNLLVSHIYLCDKGKQHGFPLKVYRYNIIIITCTCTIWQLYIKLHNWEIHILCLWTDTITIFQVLHNLMCRWFSVFQL